MRAGEFQIDNEAKRRFKIPVTTAVRKLWVPRLEALQLDVWQKLPAHGGVTADEVNTSPAGQSWCAKKPMLTIARAAR